MGINLSDIVRAREMEMKDLKGRALAIDAYNTLYQFLTTIRQPDGTPLMDSAGRITSHLSGLLYRTANFMYEGIRPIYVFDGKPPDLKAGTIEERMAVRKAAEEEWSRALEEGDVERAFLKARQSSRLTRDMVEDAKRLLDLMGIPWVQAPSEGEAQAAHMARKGDCYATASQDYDSLLFGTPRLVRNLAITGKRKLPRKRIYLDVKPEMVVLDDVLRDLGISREQLVDLAILVGTDFNEGIKRVGPKTALKLVKKYGSLAAVLKAKGWDIPVWKEVRQIFLSPEVTDDYTLKWGEVDEEGVVRFLCDERDFSEDRVRNALKKVRAFRGASGQRSLEDWF